MARKNFLSWVGFKGEGSALDVERSTSASESGVPSTGVVDRIRELEAQLADLRSRKDITSLTREEFEILATETAMNLVKTAQSREKGATAQAAKLLAESSRIATEATAAAEAKAKSILAAAESRGRKYLEVAESEGSEITATAQRSARSLTEAAKREVESLRATTAQEIESMLASKKREAASITAAAKSESEELVKGAISSITDYRNWLTSAVAESERLYKIQTQSLTAAQQAIEQSRHRLASAFERLAGLTEDIDRNLDGENQPITKEFVRSGSAQSTREESTASEGDDSSAVKKKGAVKNSPAKKSPAKKSPAKKSPAKKSPAKKKSTRK
jgi:hypothetical protein